MLGDFCYHYNYTTKGYLTTSIEVMHSLSSSCREVPWTRFYFNVETSYIKSPLVFLAVHVFFRLVTMCWDSIQKHGLLRVFSELCE